MMLAALLFPVFTLIIVADHTHHCTASLVNYVTLLNLAVRSLKSRLNGRGLRAQPRGDPVLTEMVLERGCGGPLLPM